MLTTWKKTLTARGLLLLGCAVVLLAVVVRPRIRGGPLCALLCAATSSALGGGVPHPRWRACCSLATTLTVRKRTTANNALSGRKRLDVFMMPIGFLFRGYC